MKAIFRIERHKPETKEIAVRFARLRAPLHIEKYKRLLINYSDLDCYDAESFVEGLMRKVGDNMVKEQEKNEPIINKAEKITGEFSIEDLVGKTIECKVDNFRRSRLKMIRVEL